MWDDLPEDGEQSASDNDSDNISIDSGVSDDDLNGYRSLVSRLTKGNYLLLFFDAPIFAIFETYFFPNPLFAEGKTFGWELVVIVVLRGGCEDCNSGAICTCKNFAHKSFREFVKISNVRSRIKPLILRKCRNFSGRGTF